MFVAAADSPAKSWKDSLLHLRGGWLDAVPGGLYLIYSMIMIYFIRWSFL